MGVNVDYISPGDHMYQMVNSFLLLKPALDVGHVPEFYMLFNSSAFEVCSLLCNIGGILNCIVCMSRQADNVVMHHYPVFTWHFIVIVIH